MNNDVPQLLPGMPERVLDTLPFLVAYIDTEQRYHYMNRAYSADQWFGLPVAELLGKSVREIVGEREYEKIAPYIQAALRGETVHYEIASVNAHSTVEYRETTYLPDRDPHSGAVRGYICYVQDISERKRSEERTLWLAYHDGLTGLLNRAAFYETLASALDEATQNNTQLTLLYIDLNGFKQVNDTWGHEEGDELLRLMTTRLTSRLRDGDAAARLGGDEFAVILRDTTSETAAAQAAHRIGRALAEPFSLRGKAVAITSSIGFACFPFHGNDADTLIAVADKRMYAEKHAAKALGPESVPLGNRL